MSASPRSICSVLSFEPGLWKYHARLANLSHFPENKLEISIYLSLDKDFIHVALVKKSIQIMRFFLFLEENICLGYSLQAPLRPASNEYPQHMFAYRNKKTSIFGQ